MAETEDGWDDPSAKGLTPEPDFRPVPRRAKKKRRGLWVFVGVLVVAGGAGAAGWYFLNDWLGHEPDGEVPLIRAESGPVKVRPEEPGGMEVPDRDKLVYDRMDGTEGRDTVERLLPSAEKPLPKPAPAPGTSPVPSAPQAAIPAAPVPLTPKAAPPVPPPPAPPVKADAPAAATPVAPTPAPQKVVPSVEDVLAAMKPPPVETKKQPAPAETTAKAAQPTAPAVVKGGPYQVQLSALRSREQVDAEWERLRRKNSDLLGSLELSVVRADLGPGKGVFFRLRAGPVADEQAAQALCQKLSERKIGCLVVRPEG